MILAKLSRPKPVYALYRKDVKVHILTLPLILQFVVGSVLMQRVTNISRFNSHCDKTTSPVEIGLMGCVFNCSLDSISI